MLEEEAAFCRKVTRYGPLGALAGGSVFALVLWSTSGSGTPAGMPAAISGVALIPRLVVGMVAGSWLGATAGCFVARLGTTEDRCYAGCLSTVIYGLGASLGMVIGRQVAPGTHPAALLAAGGAATSVLVPLICTLAAWGRHNHGSNHAAVG